MSITEKTLEQQAIEAAEDYVVGRDCDLHRSTIEKNWGYSKQELAKLEYNANGYLACGIQRSTIIEHGPDAYGSEQWIIQVEPDIGVEVEPDVCRVYQSADKTDWIVESEN